MDISYFPPVSMTACDGRRRGVAAEAEERTTAFFTFSHTWKRSLFCRRHMSVLMKKAVIRLRPTDTAKMLNAMKYKYDAFPESAT